MIFTLGSDQGLDVLASRNDRNRINNGVNFQDIPNLGRELPKQFDDAANKTIELVDVLWLQGDAIIVEFEVQHTKTINYRLLRISHPASIQLNQDRPLQAGPRRAPGDDRP